LFPYGDRARQHTDDEGHRVETVPALHRCDCEQRCGTPSGEQRVASGVQLSGGGSGQPEQMATNAASAINAIMLRTSFLFS
jgi:hypothetical protein